VGALVVVALLYLGCVRSCSRLLNGTTARQPKHPAIQTQPTTTYRQQWTPEQIAAWRKRQAAEQQHRQAEADRVYREQMAEYEADDRSRRQAEKEAARRAEQERAAAERTRKQRAQVEAWQEQQRRIADSVAAQQRPQDDTATTSGYPATGSGSYASSGTVHVKGYYRKDGTYVRPHTRRR